MRDTLTHRMLCTRTRMGVLCALLLAAASCDEAGEPCGVPGVSFACACGAQPGARVCTAQKTLSACDCSGAIPLPNAVVSPDGGASGGGSGGNGGAGGRAGTGGRSGSGGSAGMTGGSGGMGGSAGEDDDGGMIEPDAGGMGGDGGSGGSNPLDDTYRACANNGDCAPNGACSVTPNIPNNSTVCAPRCTVVADCPVPEGMYDSVLTCVEGFCRLDCTPVVFEPLLSCPGSMICVAALFGQSYCHAN